MTTLCRDCLAVKTEDFDRCPACGRLRTVSHPALSSLTIAHVDCDAFYASVEKRDNPALRDKPLIVGGGTRGVVTTCCYMARLYGVRSAMPMFKALKLCPEAVVVPPDFRKYHEAGRAIRARMDALTPLVQPVSIDEAYLDLSGTERLHGVVPAASLARLALEVEQQVGVTVSIGLSANKFLAKTASELDKPRGFAVLAPEDAEAFLADKPVGFLHGVGPKFAESLNRDGFHTVEDLQRAELKDLIRGYGETGEWLKRCAHGRDNRKVNPHDDRKSVSSETTFFEDTSDLAVLEDHLWRLSVKTADRAKAEGVVGVVVTLKLKTSDFKPVTRRLSLHAPTQLAQEVFRTARPLLAKEATGRVRYRLIGVGLSGLSAYKADSVDLIDPKVAKRAAAERASDKARAKFGRDAVMTGRAAKMARKDEG
ncbi:MAG: DNA polymerase IV [Hyphomonas sp.]|uniref:DNA polymerase IV n=1 Tax=Hyphomonas sp. TaxID=87 RepID=UPI0017F8F5CA|nr:DNA polymerase IV [Hyphomonas sp.]MBA3070051.1 DNA polymerase IV [Hyphomonas sp.]MBU3920362.1 DNA polymerase IV [Alphaproteobacteria bacterium]MBU4060373.1 DNA polymerase IV [Alphaproteobacteria bacterium]MBU4163041.1 DNA polymerase IV [Alphaproteobacteria bacterium]